jgi:predicted RNA-binding Zn-ribbon protein involved in translation (DUF1610 family)
MAANRANFPPPPAQKSCGKNRYRSKREAEAVASEQEIIFASQDLELTVYLCPDCGGWHLTRQRADKQ